MTDRSPRKIRFALLTGAEPLASWQRSALERLAQVPGVRLQCRIDAASARRNAALKPLGLDFILSFVAPEQGRAFRHDARFGVWQFLFDVGPLAATPPQGSLALGSMAGLSNAILAQLQEEPDHIRVLSEGRQRPYLFSNGADLQELQQRCAHWPAQVCLELLEEEGAAVARWFACKLGAGASRQQTRPATPESPVLGATHKARRLLTSLFRHEQWSVGALDAPIESLLEAGPLPPVRWLTRPQKSEFFADPFGLMRDGRLTVWCEHLDYRDGRGVIVALSPDPGEPSTPVTIGPQPAVHLSYPCVFEHEGKTWCIPETHQAREVALYELREFPDEWRRVATIVDDADLVDATPFRWQDRWWLAASKPAPKGTSSELHLWHAETLTGPWHEHPANPVKIDVCSARPAGTPFQKAGVLYRPAQDCSRAYGGRVVINRVDALTPRTFRETPVAVVDPPQDSVYTAGIHTISAAGSITLMDAKRNVFVGAEFRRALRYAFRKALGRTESAP